MRPDAVLRSNTAFVPIDGAHAPSRRLQWQVAAERGDAGSSQAARLKRASAAPGASSGAAAVARWSAKGAVAFGPFRLIPKEWLLLRDGQAVRLGSRALAILVALVERAGEIVSNDALTRIVWPDSVVADNNLRVNMAGLRKALGDGFDGHRYIENIPLKGYAFVAPLSPCDRGDDEAPPGTSTHTSTVHPGSRPTLFGRDDDITTLRGLLRQRRFVSVVGPAGVGKTALAMHALDAMREAFRDGIFVVDCSLMNETDWTVSAIAAALGVGADAEDPVGGIAAFVQSRKVLLVLDNCEHVIHPLASLAEGLLRRATRLSILCTSREPLRAEGEYVQRLAPLKLPPCGRALSTQEALRCGAIQLFTERASAAADAFELTASNLEAVVAVCRRLDGIPLALELAANHLHAFGVGDLLLRLDLRFSLAMKGRRTALPRHQTLGAALDWSYHGLSAQEQLALQRLAVLHGRFDLTAAQAAIAGPGQPDLDVSDTLSALVQKSMVQADFSSGRVTYRLLEITRDYARQKSEEGNDAGCASACCTTTPVQRGLATSRQPATAD